MKRSSIVAATLLATVSALPAGAQSPLGAEFAVNTYMTGRQSRPSVARDASGDFVVVWNSYPQDSGGYGVFGQRFTSDGSPAGGEFQINTWVTGGQFEPQVAMNALGDFVVVWRANSARDGSDYAVVGRRYDATGAAAGDEFIINTYTPGRQTHGTVAMNDSGSFVVVWSSVDQGDEHHGVFGQRFDAAGVRQGGEFHVNTYTTDEQFTSGVDVHSDGSFVVTWESGQDGSGYGIFARRFDTAGDPLGDEFQVNTYTTSHQSESSVAIDGGGSFIIVWTNWAQDGAAFGQRYSADGSPWSSEFRTTAPGVTQDGGATVSARADGGFTVVWATQDGDESGIAGQLFDSNGTAVGPTFAVNAYTTGDQLHPAVAMGDDGTFVVAWTTEGPDADDYGVAARRFDSVPLATMFEIGPEYVVAETALKVKVNVTRTDYTGGAATVDYATVDGSAKAGTDYVAKSGTLNFAPNETSKTVTITIKNDTVVEGQESFRLQLSNPTGGTLCDPESASIRINDNDGSVVFFAKTRFVALEGGPAVKVVVKRGGPLSGIVTVRVKTANVSATAGADYTAVNKVLSFGSGVTSRYVTIPITDDAALESVETFKVMLSEPTGVAAKLGTQRTGVVTIEANDE